MDTLRYMSPLGELLLTAEGDCLTGLFFEGRQSFSPSQTAVKTPVLEQTCHWLDVYFSGQEPDFLPPLRPVGTPFRQAVWRLLQEIPYGCTTTYGAIAQQIAQKRGIAKMSAQAVGGAVGANPISILIPCHRVIGADGSLTGYGGGLDKKVALLALEKADLPTKH